MRGKIYAQGRLFGCLVLMTGLAFGNIIGQNTEGWMSRNSPWTNTSSRVASDPVDVACAGTTLLEEDFETDGLPAGWIVIDGDGRTPKPNTGLQAGWQSRADYKDSSNTIMASPSWYQTGGASNDWLILPGVQLGDNPCLSWTAYSQDGSYPESYEVLISTTNRDTASFKLLPQLDEVLDEDDAVVIHAISLDDYANDSVFIAFRQFSNDKFVLAIDDIRIANVEPLDIGVSRIDYNSASPGDTIPLKFTVANYGQDTVTTFTLCYQIDNQSSECITADTITISPNETFTFTHPTEFISDTLDLFYDICAWTINPNNQSDAETSNDTLCGKIEVGSPVGRPEPVAGSLAIDIYPNPVDGAQVNLLFSDLNASSLLVVRLHDLRGKELFRRELRAIPGTALPLELNGLQTGLYLVDIVHPDGRAARKKLIVR